MTLKIPQITTPEFWLANFGKVQDYLNRQLARGVVHNYGASSLGYPLRLIEYAAPEAATKLMVLGGTHGHEPGTVASVMSLLHLLEAGTDLAGQPHPRLLELAQQLHLYLVPVLNPDGRTVCPDSFYAQGLDTVTAYACGLKKDGDLVPYDSDSNEPCYYFDPKECLFIGGQFNGAGYAINRRRSLDSSDAVEVQALLDFVKPRAIAGALDLHACGYNFAMQVRSHEAPYWDIMREWQRRAERLFSGKGRPLKPLHGDGDPPEPLQFHFNSALFHRHAQMLFCAFEGRQGYIGRRGFMPLPTEWEIVDDYLTAVEVFLELGLEGKIDAANRQVFGGQ
jgi:hypothetical protein